MSFIDLKKRRGSRLASMLGRPSEPDPVAAAPSEPLAVAEPEPEGVAIAPILPSSVLENAGLRALALGMIERRQDVLVVGLGPWEHDEWARALSTQARTVTVVDPDKNRLVGLRAHGMQTIASAFDGAAWLSRLAGQRFHAVVVGHALTHLPDPTAFLRQARELLHDGGAVVAIVPNVAYGERRLAMLKGEFPREFEPGSPLHHYTRARLRELFAFAGYTMAGLHAHEQDLFGTESELVPELFPEAMLQAVGQEDDMRTAHFVVKAEPVGAEVLLRELFDEQEQMKRAVRNELARVSRTHEALHFRLKEADGQIETLADELLTARQAIAGMEEMTQRHEHNIKRLAREADEAKLELAGIKSSLSWRLIQLFKSWRKPNPVLEAMPGNGKEPGLWKYDG